MANIYLNFDTSKLTTPFSFAEKIAPLQLYKADYEKDEERYQQLAEKIGDLQYAVASSKGVVKDIYDTYNNQLQAATEGFSSGPMTNETRRQLSALRKDYGLKIRGIEKAQQALQQEAELRRKEIMQDDSMVYQNPNLSIDDFYGQTPTNLGGISANKVTARVAAKASAVAKSVFSDPEFSKILGGQKYLMMQANGASVGDMALVMSNNLNEVQDEGLRTKLQSFRKIIDDERQAIGIDKYGLNDQAKLNNAIMSGMYSGLSQPTYNLTANEEYVSAADRQRLTLERERLDLSRQEMQIKANEPTFKQDKDGNWIKIEPSYIYGQDANGKWALKPNPDAGNPTIVADASGNPVTPESTPTQLPGGASATDRAKSLKRLAVEPIYTYRNLFSKTAISKLSPTRKGYNPDDAHLISFDQFSESTQDDLKEYLKLHYPGVSPQDVNIFVDKDFVNDNHYVIVPKGYNAKGEVAKKGEEGYEEQLDEADFEG